MSQLFAALEKQKRDSEAARAKDASGSVQAFSDQQVNADLREDAGAEAPASILSLPPMLTDYSKQFSGEIALLYRSLSVANQGAPGSILICGAEWGAGTTTVALNLASYAVTNEGRRTLFVEADFQSPYLAGAVGGKKVGFSDLLAEQGAIGNYVSPTSIPGLDVMNTGRIVDANERLVTQNRVRYILSESKEKYPFIIFDGAPIGAGPTTLELAQAVDGVVMVARANALAGAVDRAKLALERAKADILGVVYNDY